MLRTFSKLSYISFKMSCFYSENNKDPPPFLSSNQKRDRNGHFLRKNCNFRLGGLDKNGDKGIGLHNQTQTLFY